MPSSSTRWEHLDPMDKRDRAAQRRPTRRPLVRAERSPSLDPHPRREHRREAHGRGAGLGGPPTGRKRPRSPRERTRSRPSRHWPPHWDHGDREQGAVLHLVHHIGGARRLPISRCPRDHRARGDRPSSFRRECRHPLHLRHGTEPGAHGTARRGPAERDPSRRLRALLALDELANIAPLPDLPQIVSEGGGQGVLTIGCLQDLSQARTRWGTEADGFLSLFSSTLLLGGVADRSTLRAFSDLAGTELVARRSITQQGSGLRRRSSTDSYSREPALPLDAVASSRPGEALLLDARKAVGRVTLTVAHRDEPWRSRMVRGLARQSPERGR